MRTFWRVAFVALLTLLVSVCSTVDLSFAAAAAVGDVLVADPGSGTVRHFSAAGADLGVFASGFSSLTMWITADRSGNVYVSEHEDQRISKLSPTGERLLTIPTPYQPGGVLAADGTIYVADFFNGRVYRYSASGADLGLFASTTLARIDFMAFDAGGNLYVADPLLEVVRRLSPTGEEDLDDFATGFPGPAGIAFDAQGNAYIASFNSGFVEKYSPSGPPETFALIDLRDSIFGIAFDASGNLYAANYAAGTILKFSPVGADLGVFASTGLVRP